MCLLRIECSLSDTGRGEKSTFAAILLPKRGEKAETDRHTVDDAPLAGAR
jgi:hypothetical protein